MSTRNDTMFMRKWHIVFLYFYYSLLLISSLIAMLFIITCIDNLYNICNIYIASTLSSVIGSTMYYIRKLYKDGLNNKFIITKDAVCCHLFAYYFFRPIFSVASAIFVIMGIKQGFFLLSISNDMNDANFFYLSSFISFLIGYNISKMFGVFSKENIIL